MKTEAKKYSLILLIVLVMPVLSYLFLYNFQKQIIRQEVKKNFEKLSDKKDLVLLKFSKAESKNLLVWVKANEFKYNDMMYDIFETYSKNDSVFYWCHKDINETKLIKKYNNFFLKNHKSNKKDHKVCYFFQILYINECLNYDFNQNSTKDIKFQYFFSVSSFYKFPVLPPPKSEV